MINQEKFIGNNNKINISLDYILYIYILLQILVLLITAISTMLQMKDHPWMLYLKNALLANVHQMQNNY